MQKNNNISQISVSCFSSLKCGIVMILLFMSVFAAQGQSVVVNAGPDQVICNSDTLFLSNLNAQISGLVNDGFWFTTGDGYFAPSNLGNVQFSLGTSYVPGPSDIASGGFNLILVSFDPDGFGPLVQVSDMVHIKLMGNIAMVCNSNLNIALGPDCTQSIVPTMLVANLMQPYEFYNVSLKDATGKKIPGNLLTAEHIGQVIEYTVGHECGTNSCWGYLKVEDKLPPPLSCSNKILMCGSYTQADSLGLPVSAQAIAKKTGPKSYRVLNLDACSPASLTYNDVYQPLTCETGIQGRLTRTWIAMDTFGNTSSCFQVITIRNRSLEQVSLPFHFDDLQKPAFECGGNWPKTIQGYPSVDTTGLPGVKDCTNLAATFTDTKIDACGASFKIIRKWTLINWCGTLVTEHNQLIKVRDSMAPVASCPGDTIISTSPYTCGSLLYQLPSPLVTNECSDWNYTVTLIDTLSGFDASSYLTDGSNGKPAVYQLPLGTYYVIYHITDACGNTSECSFLLTVADNAVPIAVCDQVTKVALDVSGKGRVMASTIDDGSTDNCGIIEYKIAKMTDGCGATALLFSDFADFCCSESSTSVMVALRVTDFSGNSNTCMVEVKVEDKLPPTISCPSHLTISCRTPIDTSDLSAFGNIAAGSSAVLPIYIYDEFNNGLAGHDGYYRDNCTGIVTSKVIDQTTCFQGLIRRVFTVTDKSGNIASCAQNIRISNPDPFSIEDIVFPGNKESNGCGITNANPDVTGRPVFNNTKCANVAATYEDQVFPFTDGACVKIIRTWTVIDWCQFDANTGFGSWKGLQILKFNNKIDPVFTSPCRDTTVCNYADNCGPALYEFTPQTADDCTSDSLLSFEWKIDLFHDGIFDLSGTGKTVKAELLNGKHKVRYRVYDACGNFTDCEYFVTLKDCKKPTPYCIASLTSVIMPSSGQLPVKAESFNFSSFDNCTPAALLRYSFTENIADTTKILSCADIPDGKQATLEIKMWVSDLAGNKEYCAVHLTIIDNGNVCQDENSVTSVSGLVWQAGTLEGIAGVKLNITAHESDKVYTAYSASSGNYTVDSVITGSVYKIQPSKNDSIAEGLSTLDVVLIQRHILGAARFTDPFKIIAADLDGNKKVTVSDLVILRKIILGYALTLPGNRDCYTFVDDAHVFANPSAPFGYPEYRMTPLATEKHINGMDFTAVKMGDVNFSLSLHNPTSENRSSTEEFVIQQSNKGIQVYFGNSLLVSGFQFSLPLPDDPGKICINPALAGDIEYFFNGYELKIIYAPSSAVSWDKGVWLLSCENAFLSENSTSFSNEWYDASLTVHKLDYKVEASASSRGEQIELIPALNSLLIRNHTESSFENLEITIYDLSGKVLDSRKLDQLYPGSNVYSNWSLPSQRMYLARLHGRHEEVSVKWFYP